MSVISDRIWNILRYIKDSIATYGFYLYIRGGHSFEDILMYTDGLDRLSTSDTFWCFQANPSVFPFFFAKKITRFCDALLLRFYVDTKFLFISFTHIKYWCDIVYSYQNWLYLFIEAVCLFVICVNNSSIAK